MIKKDNYSNNILEKYRNSDRNNYDCVFHLDGTFENIAILHHLKFIHKMNPLGVTLNHFDYDNSHKINIRKSLEVYDVDHIMFTPRLSVIERLKTTYPEAFNSLVNQAINSFLFMSAKRYNLKLCVTSLNMNSLLKCETNDDIILLKKMLTQLKIIDVNNLLNENFTEFDLLPYKFPNKEIKNSDLHLLNPLNSFNLSEPSISEFINQNFSFDKLEDVDNHLFWLGFTDDWEFDKNSNTNRKKTNYEILVKKSVKGKPLFDGKLKYCTRCCMPETAEAFEFDELGMCQPCASSEQKMHINWLKRKETLKKLLNKYSADNNDYYDCMVPISGGKDSTFQLYVLTELYNKRILASTFNANWMTKTGRKNLQNAIVKFDIDHVNFTPRRNIINKLAKKSLSMIGDACWHCHAGVGSFPLQVAVDFKIKLLIWGESVSENDGRATYENPIPFDRDYFTKISARFYAEEMIDENINSRDVLPYTLPSVEEIEKEEIIGIHLGDYMFWDDESQMEFVRDNYGWEEDKVEGSYKGYKSVECIMEGVHVYSNLIKRGYGRATYHASEDVRKGLLLRSEGFELGKKHDTERPKVLDYYLGITGYKEEEFEQVIKKTRDKNAKRLNKYDPPKD